MKRFLRRLRALWRLAGTYEANRMSDNQRVANLEKLIRERTDISVDVGFSPDHKNTVIVVGNYRNVGYVQTFQLSTSDFKETVDDLKRLKRWGSIQTIDAPPQMRHVFERELL